MTIAILAIAGIAFGWFKYKTRKKEKEPITPPFKPLPKPEPTPEPIHPVVEPEPVPEIPKYSFNPYVFKPVLFLKQTDKSKVVKIDVVPEIDNTDYIQAQLDALPKDNSFNDPLVIEFPNERIWTEGNLSRMGVVGQNGAVYFKGFKNFIVRGGQFYTKAPASPYGGNIGLNQYSHRRHFRFEDCEDFIVEEISVEGSNLIDGRLIGTTPELTPEFWKGGKDNGSIGGSPAYKSYWEFEHAFDFLRSKRFILRNVKVNGVWGDGICIGDGCEDFHIENAYLRFVGRQGVAVYGSKRGLLDNIWVDLGRRASFDFEPNTATSYANEIEVKNFKAEAAMTAFAGLGRGDVSDIYIHDGTLKTSGHSFIFGDAGNKTTRKNMLVKNVVREGGGFGSPLSDIRFHMTDNIVFENCHLPIGSTQSKRIAQFMDCQNVEFTDNDFGAGEEIIYRNSTIKAEGIKLTEI